MGPFPGGGMVQNPNYLELNTFVHVGHALFAIFLGFGSQLIAMTIFYFLISLWFHFYRYKFVRRGDQFTMPWPKPQGY